MTRIERPIGGVFGLLDQAETGTGYPAIRSSSALCLVNGRSAIAYLLEAIGTERVWLPSYLCESVLAAVGVREARWYDVADGLAPTDLNWLEEVAPGDFILCINYFGWRPAAGFYPAMTARGALILEDGSQSMLTEEIGEGAHFYLTVPRKFVGVPDGAVLMASGEMVVPRQELIPPPEDWWRIAHRANLGRRASDLGVGRSDWYRDFAAAERSQPIGLYAMSDISRELLGRLDPGWIRARRRRNYLHLESALRPIALFESLPPEVVPLGFPGRLPDRDERRRQLIDRQIFPPVHWPIEGVVPDRFQASHRLSSQILTLPCDQRYDSFDMDRIIEVLSS